MTSELRPVGSNTDAVGKRIVDNYKHILSWDWIFSEWYEKIIVAGAILWTAYCIVKFIYGLI